jgi:hypothetical protein
MVKSMSSPMMTAKEELIQAIERSPDEIVWALLEILKILERRTLLTTAQSTPEASVSQLPNPKPQSLAASLIGIAKTDMPPPTDEEVKAILDERLVQKYL